MQVWTAHAVSGGLGVEARWYEIDVAPIINATGGPGLTQSGKASSSTLDVWNAASVTNTDRDSRTWNAQVTP
jgi:hypothetical protein